jgi:hypothetical protein
VGGEGVVEDEEDDDEDDDDDDELLERAIVGTVANSFLRLCFISSYLGSMFRVIF